MRLSRRLSIAITALLAAGACAAVPAAPAPGNEPPGLTATTAETGLPRAPEQEAVAFEHADLHFRVDPAQRRIDGDAALTFRALRPLSRLVVDLDRNYAIAAVDVDGQALPTGAWSNPQGRMSVSLPQPLAAGARTTLRIRYGGAPHVATRAPWDGGFVWSRAPTGETWVASAIQGEGCDLLWPCIDHPQGEPRRVDLHVSVPAPLVAVGNGVATGMDEQDGWRTYHWRARDPTTYAIAINVGPYELLADEYRSRFGNTIPLRFWYLRGNAAKARALFAEFPKLLEFFEASIGPYPFGDEKMGVVETPYLGMEHQTVNAYGNDYKLTEFGYDWLLQHEFAHEWFGNQMTNADWDDMWLHEGFGSYMQPLYLQWLRGDREYDAWLLNQRKTLANKVPIVSGHAMTEDAVYNRETGPGLDIYYKGSLLLHTLRQLIGDQAFFAATRQLVYGTATPRPGNFRPRYASTRDFIDAVNAATGRDYGWFFDVYVYSAALPELLATRDATGLTLQWGAPGGKPFPMPLQVRVDGRDIDLPMADGRGRIELSPHALYTIDPHSRVLRALPYIDAYQADAAARQQAAAAAKAAEDKPAE
ncbi:M1 family metallopeptidase [Cognatiluteimonas weifangensis]|uniref:Aminopeptidase N n=1 Tax=Cognatiluteimonas weifangensis TaxID=2303539 RepID=A0A372DMZ6_9GAMM|nr:M1 family metallopeptidase [Luteimonas weifangensis]RFP60906.1 M1 family peptidase [Luteimonas weifangensis]